MWKPRLNFIRLHYAYIVALSIVGMILIYPARNMAAIDALFFGVSAATMTGLNTIDVKDLKLYQQLVIYFIPLLANIGFINPIVVFVRLYWFKKKLQRDRMLSQPLDTSSSPSGTVQSQGRSQSSELVGKHGYNSDERDPRTKLPLERKCESDTTTADADVGHSSSVDNSGGTNGAKITSPANDDGAGSLHISFADPKPRVTGHDKALRIPGPRDVERGAMPHEIDEEDAEGDPAAKPVETDEPGPHRKLPSVNKILSHASSIDRVTSSAFVLGERPGRDLRLRSSRSLSRTTSKKPSPSMPYLSYKPTIGRNSKFLDLTEEQREELGGIEYRSLKLLAKIVVAYYVFFHVFGAICLIGWIHGSSRQYKDYLESLGQDKTWWGIYSSMTTYNNLGFTLTPDSMIHFRTAIFPMLLMTFLMYVGNTAYPCLLRLIIWILFKLVPRNSALKEPLNFLLDHPRRCYTLLFPSGSTWMLLGILVVLNLVDIILMLVLDLHNPEVSNLSPGHRIVATIFQAASSRTTGTATFNLANVHPAVQFSLMVMMYISVFPIAMSVRQTNIYEESSLGIYSQNEEIDETQAVSYIGVHLRKQLSFDTWYIFLGVFLISVVEGPRIADKDDYAIQIFSIFFEVVSAYGNVGLSLGYPTVNTSLCGQFHTLSKLVICAMMIRGRHRGLPYELDRAILLPSEKLEREETTASGARLLDLSRRHTS
ncbi:potassium uptake transporter [Thermoascus aurantiacus ATCC 26904]